MWPIILESVLFLTLLGVVGTIVVALLRQYTPLGTRLAQSGNRKMMERAAALTCPRHGWHEERALVRLPSGETMCPQCYQESLDGILD